jgi:hypothetical protein
MPLADPLEPAAKTLPKRPPPRDMIEALRASVVPLYGRAKDNL